VFDEIAVVGCQLLPRRDHEMGGQHDGHHVVDVALRVISASPTRIALGTAIAGAGWTA
jgi:hypothetical protein